MRWSLLDLNFKQDQVLTVGGTKFWTHTPNVCVCVYVCGTNEFEYGAWWTIWEDRSAFRMHEVLVSHLHIVTWCKSSAGSFLRDGE